METLEEVFSIWNHGVMAECRISRETACILLTLARSLLYKVCTMFPPDLYICSIV